MIVRNQRLRSTINRCCERFALPWLAFARIPLDGRICFYRRDRNDFEFLSNFYVIPIEIEGVIWPHTEAFYQSQKSHCEAYKQKILERPEPSWSKYVGDSRLGHNQLARESWFKNRPQDLRDDWGAVKLDVMRIAINAKFSQNRNLRRALRNTSCAEIVEDSPTDAFWGIGKNGDGANWLGVILSEYRSEL